MSPRRMCAGLVCLAALAVSLESQAITRDEVITTAKAFVYHPWRCTNANLTAPCSSTYHSLFEPGDYIGLPYDWGGYMNLFEFDQQIAQGDGAGSPYNGDILDCTAGVDCSGFASQCLHVSYHTTDMMADISTVIAQSELLAGDIINKSGYHVVLFSHLLGSGEPYVYEATPPYSTRAYSSGGWAYVNGFTPRRYQGITGTSAGNPVGTLDNPIKIGGTFPYTDSRDTSKSSSDVFDGCSLSSSTKESGPEYVYEVTFTQPGSLTVSVSDDVGVDIDVHLYGSRNTSDCLARNDTTFTTNVDCGTYYIVADTFAGSAEYPGAYTLNVTFTPSGGSCGNGPPKYDPAGAIGDHCTDAYPYCNATLGGEVCILTTPDSDSFCSKSCKTAADCTVFAGGCCEALTSGSYCLKAAYCGGGGAGGSPGTGGSAGQGGNPGQGGSPGQGGTAGSGGTPSEGGKAGSPGSGGSTNHGGSPGSGGLNGGAGGDAPGDDAGTEEPQADAASEDSGCGCRTAPQNSSSLAWVGAIAMLLARRRRQRS
jgi:MYXO-CTERM domain-containing protein